MSQTTTPSISSLIYKVIRAIPILGYAARCIDENRETEFYVLAFVLFEAVLVAFVLFGFPALITFALTATALAFVSVLLATRA